MQRYKCEYVLHLIIIYTFLRLKPMSNPNMYLSLRPEIYNSKALFHGQRYETAGVSFSCKSRKSMSVQEKPNRYETPKHRGWQTKSSLWKMYKSAKCTSINWYREHVDGRRRKGNWRLRCAPSLFLRARLTGGLEKGCVWWLARGWLQKRTSRRKSKPRFWALELGYFAA